MRHHDEDIRTTTARREVRALRRIYRFLLTYLMVVGALLAINLAVTPQRLWVIHVALAWGIGIAVLAARALVLDRHFDAGWEQRQIDRRLGRGDA